MALFFDHMRPIARPWRGGADAPAALKGAPAALKCRPAPSRRVPQTTMPYRVCLRLAGAWFGGLGLLLAVVLTLRWYA
jgi:hypothetical protein